MNILIAFGREPEPAHDAGSRRLLEMIRGLEGAGHAVVLLAPGKDLRRHLAGLGVATPLPLQPNIGGTGAFALLLLKGDFDVAILPRTAFDDLAPRIRRRLPWCTLILDAGDEGDGFAGQSPSGGAADAVWVARESDRGAWASLGNRVEVMPPAPAAAADAREVAGELATALDGALGRAAAANPRGRRAGIARKLSRSVSLAGVVVGRATSRVGRLLVAVRDRLIPHSSLAGNDAAAGGAGDRPQVCPACGDHRYRVYFSHRLNRTVICWRCGMFYTNPLPREDELRERVAESSTYTDDQLAKLGFFTRRAEALLDRVERMKSPGRLLDIGCAIGTELVVARKRGWDVTGIELSESSVRAAREQGLHVLDVPLHECGFPDAAFDLVTLNHVLEHIHEPAPFLAEVRRILKDDGLLFIAVPNVNAWKRYLEGANYHWSFHDDHFLHFSPASLARLLSRHGFAPLDLATSRWCDFHDELAGRSGMFRAVNTVVERLGRGIEIFCLCKPAARRAGR